MDSRTPVQWKDIALDRKA